MLIAELLVIYKYSNDEEEIDTQIAIAQNTKKFDEMYEALSGLKLNIERYFDPQTEYTNTDYKYWHISLCWEDVDSILTKMTNMKSIPSAEVSDNVAPASLQSKLDRVPDIGRMLVEKEFTMVFICILILAVFILVSLMIPRDIIKRMREPKF